MGKIMFQFIEDKTNTFVANLTTLSSIDNLIHKLQRVMAVECFKKYWLLVFCRWMNLLKTNSDCFTT